MRFHDVQRCFFRYASVASNTGYEHGIITPHQSPRMIPACGWTPKSRIVSHPRCAASAPNSSTNRRQFSRVVAQSSGRKPGQGGRIGD
ncbi:hypothetical protein M446_6889 [Methylobacterium sp. 4-46]|nr:hypothetical protein M446_6889 [Methylobacterium sp. 4-46]